MRLATTLSSGSTRWWCAQPEAANGRVVVGNSYFWRKGKTHYIVSIDLHDYFSPEAKLSSRGPHVIVQAAYEERDSEDT